VYGLYRLFSVNGSLFNQVEVYYILRPVPLLSQAVSLLLALKPGRTRPAKLKEICLS